LGENARRRDNNIVGEPTLALINQKKLETKMNATVGDDMSLEAERERHKARAEKFGIPYNDPAQSRRREFKQQVVEEQRASAGFSTGFSVR